MFSFGSGVDRGFNDPFIEPLPFAMPTESTAEASCFCFRVRTPDMVTVRESQLLTLFTSSNLRIVKEVLSTQRSSKWLWSQHFRN
jgi:hypothetical protein